MIEASEMLRSYVRGILNLSGAECVSLFVPAPLSGLSRPILIHEGDGDPVSELADVATAVDFATTADARTRRGQDGGATEYPVLVSATDADGALVPLPNVESVWSRALALETVEEGPPTRRRSDADRSAPANLPAAWLGLKFPPGETRIPQRLTAASLATKVREQDEASRWWDWLFALGGAMASHTTQVSAILRDPITGMPDRAGFQAVLSEELEKARRDERPLSLMLINPDDFATMNERFGREAGDRIIFDISGRLRTALRSSDPVARYGGVIFAAILIGADSETAQAVAEKVHQQVTEGAFLNGAVRLGFSIGLALFDPADPALKKPLELIRRADQALNAAKRLGGGCIVDWEERSGAEETGAFDRLSGIFTGNMAKDYRNMVLLSEAINMIAVHRDFEGLAGDVVERLYAAFKPDRVGLFARDEAGGLHLVRGLTRRTGEAIAQKRVEIVELDFDQKELLNLAIASGGPREMTIDEADSATGRLCCAVPLISGDDTLGCLYLDGRKSSLALESADLIFLKAFGSQIAIALDRASLAERERQHQEQEQRRLRAELNELRQALQQAKLVYRSAEIEALVTTARRVAPTDATVLITGESGTGKELLARTVHELSTRSEKPMVVVDCGSIATSLIESELFGHEKGAYTGAQQRRIGRLAEANGGTVLLDEIGELPLEVQSKLLRFVQEKQFTTVGGTRPRRVDVRIIAATNRDLAIEVAAGRFREDLFYRLNVVRLEVPPLRDRPDDILHLGRHFVEAFSIQYQKNIRRMTPELEDRLLRHLWPGNVRELQNRLMQAVILCERDELGIEEVQLPEAADAPAPAVGRPATAAGVAGRGATPAGEEAAPAGPEAIRERLRRALARQIDLALGAGSGAALPLGKWLSDDLILEANEAAGGVARRGAAIVGMPETTFRRRLTKASQLASAGLSPRTGTWEEVRSILGEMVRTAAFEGQDLLVRNEQLLLREILERVPQDTRTGSNLLGVTAPTFRVRVAALEEPAPETPVGA